MIITESMRTISIMISVKIIYKRTVLKKEYIKLETKKYLLSLFLPNKIMTKIPLNTKKDTK